ncbi:MAG TPA: ABC transporter substrate-binding protein [Devosiaceae bacterium]|jgi:peptide/nickel transport system substrate-binding protein|nr:ABC transporter substrate-binding protein [Devosiaceae bacterium]
MTAGRILKSTALAGLLAMGAGVGPALAETLVTMNTVQIFSTIDPAKISDYTDYMAAVNLYDALVSVDEKGNLIPKLASSWDVSADAKEVTYHLRPDAHFSDGSPVTAADVVYTFERLLKINQGPANLFADVLKPGSITAVDDHTVKFILSKTFAPFLATVPSVFILNSKLVEANKGSDDGQTYLSTHTAGAGGYLLKSWDRGAQMTITRDPKYYGGWNEHPIDSVHWIITNDEATVKSLAASGELTMSSQFQSPETYDSLRQDPRFNVVKANTASAFYLKLNTKKAPTDDVHVRKAIACATDYETIQQQINPGGPLNGPLPDIFADYVNKDLPPPKFDMDCAKAEMDKSAYAGKTDIPISIQYVSGTKFEEDIALLMQSNLEQLGFKVTAQPDPWNRVTDLATKLETSPNMSEIFFEATYPSPDSMFFTQYDSKAAGTWASLEWLQNPDIDALIEKARATGDHDQQVAIYKDLQAKLVDLQPDAFLETQVIQHAMDKCLSGFKYIPMQSFSYDFKLYSWTCPAK